MASRVETRLHRVASYRPAPSQSGNGSTAKGIVTARSVGATTVSISPALVSTWAGNGSIAVADGPAGTASFADPRGLHIIGTFGYIFDSGYLRRVDLGTGAVLTVAGTGIAGYSDSTDPNQATVNGSGVMADDGTYLYFTNNCGYYGEYSCLRRMSVATGAISTIGQRGSYAGYTGLAVGPGGALFGASGNTIERIDPVTGVSTVVVTAAPAGAGNTASLGAMTTDGTVLFVTARDFDTYSNVSNPRTISADPATGTVTQITGWAPAYLVSAGSYLYAVAAGAAGDVRQITKATGVTVSIAGTASTGYLDGTGTQAWFNGINAIDTDGTNLLVSDNANHRIRKLAAGTALAQNQSARYSTTVSISPALVSTWAGNGSTGVVDGPAGTASFANPRGMHVISTFGYMFDSGFLRRIDLSSGAVTTVAGTGTTGYADNTNPALATVNGTGVMADDGTYLYFTNTCGGYGEYSCLRRMSLLTGAISTIAQRTAGSFASLATGPGGVLFTATGDAIERIDTVNGTVSTVMTVPSVVFGTTASLTAMTADNALLFFAVTDYDTNRNALNPRTISVDPGTGTVTQITGWAPAYLVSAGSYLYAVAAGAAGDVRQITKATGVTVSIAGTGSTGYLDGTGSQAWFNGVNAIDTDGTNLFVSDNANHRIRKLAPAAALARAQPARYSNTVSISPALVSPWAGNGANGVVDGAAGTASFANPRGMHVIGTYGYLSDSGYLRRVDLSSGAVTTVAGTGTTGYADNTNPALATVNGTGVMADDGTYLYFTNTCGGYGEYSCLRRMSLLTGAISTLMQRNSGAFTSLTTGPGGALFTAAGNAIERIDTVNNLATPVVTVPIPTDHSGPLGTYYLSILSMTGDASSLYVNTMQTPNGGFYTPCCTSLLRINPTNGAISTLAADDNAQHSHGTGQLVSAGNYLYGAYISAPYPDGSTTSGVARWSKTTGALEPIASAEAGTTPAGTAPVLPGLSGLDVSGTTLFAADQTARVVYRLAQAPPPPSHGDPLANATAGGNETTISGSCADIATASPVTCSSGDFWHTFTDVAVAGRGGGMRVDRTFNSVYAAQNGPFGFGWSCSFCRSLTLGGNGQVTINAGNGARVSFTSNGTGGFTAAQGQFAKLVVNSDGSYTYTARARQTFTFSPAGALTAASDVDGNTLTYGYTGANLTSITDKPGRVITLAYTGGVLSSITDPLNRVTSYTYDGAGNLASSTDPSNRVTSYTYDANHLMLTMTDPAHGTVTNTYDAQARVLTQTDPAQRMTSFAYAGSSLAAAGGTTTITDPNGDVRVEQFVYGTLTAVTKAYGTSKAATWTHTLDPVTLAALSVTDPNGKVSRQTFDAAGNVASTTDADGRVTTFTYDALNDPLTVTNSANVTTTMTYTPTGHLASTSTPLGTGTATTSLTYADTAHPGDVTAGTDAKNHTTRFGYDAYGNVNRITDADGNITTATFDADGQKLTAVTANGNVTGCACAAANTTTFAYYSNGQTHTVTDPKGGVSTFTYDPNGNLATSQDPTLLTTTSTYDADNELKTVTRPDGTVTTYGYDLNSRRTTVQVGTQPAAVFTYDALDHVLTATDPVGKVTTNTYDTGGRLTSTLSANGGATNYTYFDAGQLKTVTSPTGGVTTYAYDTAARVASVTDPLTNVTGYAYDTLGRPTVTTRTDATTTVNAYDPGGQLTSYTDGASKITSYTYTPAGRLTSSTDPNSRVTTYGYDATGNATTVTDALNRVTTSTFDTLNRVTKTAYSDPATPTITYGYDAAGRRSNMTDASGTTTNAYDAYGRLKSVTAPAGVTGYTYDSLGRITTVTYPDGHAVTRGYDAADRFSTLTDWTGKVTTFGYDNDSNLTSTAFPNGVTDTTTLNSADQPTGIAIAKGATSLASFGYTPDPAGQLKTGTDSLAPAALSTTFGYSKLNQLGSVASATSAYTYDKSGNLTGLMNGSTLTYDNAGQLKVLTPTSGPATTFAFNAVGDRTSATTPSTAAPTPATIGADVNVSADVSTGTGTVSTATFNTTTASELLIALVSAGPGTGTQSVTVTGAGLTWTRVAQANTQSGAAEIWTATATAKLAAQKVTATQVSKGGKLSLQVLSFTGASGIGAKITGGATTGAAKAALTTTRGNSLTFAVGYNGTATATPVVATGQTLLHKLTTSGTTGNAWMQRTTAATPTSGTAVTLATTAPTNLAWNMAGVEILATLVPAPPTVVTYAYDQASHLTSYAKTGTNTTTYTHNGDGLRAAATTGGVTTTYAWDTMAGLPLLLADGTNDYLYGRPPAKSPPRSTRPPGPPRTCTPTGSAPSAPSPTRPALSSAPRATTRTGRCSAKPAPPSPRSASAVNTPTPPA